MWLPPKVSQELVEGRREFRAELEARLVRAHLRKVESILNEFNYELRRIDPKLELVRIDGAADTQGLPVRPGYYHVVRWNDGAPPSVMIVEGERGEFVEPTSRLFERLAQSDLWDPGNMRLLRQRERLAEEAAEKRKVREREERQQEILERWQAGTRTFVSMDRSAPWSQNHAGRRGARGR
jgi:hypothetical protein